MASEMHGMLLNVGHTQDHFCNGIKPSALNQDDVLPILHKKSHTASNYLSGLACSAVWVTQTMVVQWESPGLI